MTHNESKMRNASMPRVILVALSIILSIALSLSVIGALTCNKCNISLAYADNVNEQGEASTEAANAAAPAADCTATVKYYEYADYEDPMYPLDDSGRIFLGEVTLSGLHEGQVLDAWDYVIDIPGHFFFDGWPATITVSKDSSKNVFEFMYFKKYEYEYTVNYYLMVGADLTASNWAGALAPEGVEFIKLGSETFADQRINKLVIGDAYEYKLDGMYVIDTYPSEIRVGFNPDDNVINVLYTPDSMNLPDDIEVPDFVEGTEGDGSTGGSDETLPPDESMDKDDLVAILPDSVLMPDGTESEDGLDDFLGNGQGPDDIIISDEMLQNPVDKEQAQQIAEAYKAGLAQRSLAQTSDDVGAWPIMAIGIGLLAALIAMITAILARRKPKSA